ncbi:M15 family metallopeptidase [Demequina aurantiaca]|uniref:M15 family metallopeptidase n=1 Tax=Demequina aurantiaca TaxID=676200 RepID=UPI003D32CEFA
MRNTIRRSRPASHGAVSRTAVFASAAVLSVVVLAGCSGSAEPIPTATATATVTHTPAPVTITASPSPVAAAADDQYARPLWLGANPLAIDSATELGKRADTPEALRDRQLEPRPFLPDPTSEEWTATVSDVPEDVLERSTWASNCPVALDDLSYVTMPYWGFDQQVHQGEMLIHRTVAADVVTAFEKIYAAKFPIEEMRVITRFENEAPPTGDQNITSGFTCRKIVGTSDVWSEHSKGYAIDINPFHNPYIRDEALFPELSEAYLDRDDERPGMIADPGLVYDAFTEIGWDWGGHWDALDDWMHFSKNGG